MFTIIVVGIYETELAVSCGVDSIVHYLVSEHSGSIPDGDTSGFLYLQAFPILSDIKVIST